MRGCTVLLCSRTQFHYFRLQHYYLRNRKFLAEKKLNMWQFLQACLPTLAMCSKFGIKLCLTLSSYSIHSGNLCVRMNQYSHCCKTMCRYETSLYSTAHWAFVPTNKWNTLSREVVPRIIWTVIFYPGKIKVCGGPKWRWVGFLRVLRFPLQSSFAPPITPQSPLYIIQGKCTIGQCVAAVLGLIRT
jgi:hypothetical protein